MARGAYPDYWGLLGAHRLLCGLEDLSRILSLRWGGWEFWKSGKPGSRATAGNHRPGVQLHDSASSSPRLALMDGCLDVFSRGSKGYLWDVRISGSEAR